jgi:hypothetical protein
MTGWLLAGAVFGYVLGVLHGYAIRRRSRWERERSDRAAWVVNPPKVLETKK